MWSTVAHKGHLDIFDRKLVTTWMGDRLGIPRVVGSLFRLRRASGTRLFDVLGGNLAAKGTQQSLHWVQCFTVNMVAIIPVE